MNKVETNENKKEIIITKRNFDSTRLCRKDFLNEQDYKEYNSFIKKFLNNTKYYFNYKCINCLGKFVTYHWVLKCPHCKKSLNNLNSYKTQMYQHLKGYWDKRNIQIRFKNTSIY
ncbi:hypothetical protein [Spiroplasma endosymbiont of Atherix ibis]|uniref:hypothetical protein n=1 Tax=Spiroplasma endosymbiont of Atherix ibis TaxID=3066291 RepID=UPI0030D0DD3F